MKISPPHPNKTSNKIILWFKTFYSFSGMSINMSAISWIFYGPLGVSGGSGIAIEVKIMPKRQSTEPTSPWLVIGPICVWNFLWMLLLPRVMVGRSDSLKWHHKHSICMPPPICFPLKVWYFWSSGGGGIRMCFVKITYFSLQMRFLSSQVLPDLHKKFRR